MSFLCELSKHIILQIPVFLHSGFAYTWHLIHSYSRIFKILCSKGARSLSRTNEFGGCLKMSYFGTNCVLNIHANTGIKKSASISEMTILYAQQYIHIDLRGIIWHILSLFTVCTVVHYCKTDLATQKVVDIVSVASIVHNTKWQLNLSDLDLTSSKL